MTQKKKTQVATQEDRVREIKVSPTDVENVLTPREKDLVKMSHHYDPKRIDRLYKEKYPWLNSYKFFRTAMQCISTIHEFGANKYSYYSHVNIPQLSYNTLDDGIEASRRHFDLYRTGNLIDESGINHIAHLCCRGGSMLLTRVYRLVMKRNEVKRTYHRTEVNDCLMRVRGVPNEVLPVYMDQITPEVIVSMTKFKPEHIPNDVDACMDVITECFDKLAMGVLVHDWDPYNDIHYVDLILWCAAYIVNTIPETEQQCLDYLAKLK